jgi:heme-degrading monooxygenase HmoA
MPRWRRRPPIEEPPVSVVKINVLSVPPDQRETLEQRFAARAGAVESSDGFEWFELLRPVEGADRYLVYTRWRDEAAFEAWRAGQSHDGPGQGQAPAATGAELWSYEVVQSAGPKA